MPLLPLAPPRTQLGMDADEAQLWWDWMETRGISYVNWSIAD